MMHRDWLESALPPGSVLERTVARAVGPATDHADAIACLNWLAEAEEADRFPRPAWKTAQIYEPAWSVTMSGLRYKSESQYMTTEGWNLGTRCWFVTIECGWRAHVTAADPMTCLWRAVALFSITLQWRDTHPRARGHFDEFAERVIAAAQEPTP